MRILPLLTLLLLLPFAATAASKLSPEATKKILDMAKEAVWSGKAEGPNGVITTPPKGKDKTIAYIPDSEANEVLHAGLTTGMLQTCKLPSKAFAGGFMNQQKKAGRNEYQLAYVNILHNIGMSTALAGMKGVCPPEVKSSLQKNFDKK